MDFFKVFLSLTIINVKECEFKIKLNVKIYWYIIFSF